MSHLVSDDSWPFRSLNGVDFLPQVLESFTMQVNIGMQMICKWSPVEKTPVIVVPGAREPTQT